MKAKELVDLSAVEIQDQIKNFEEEYFNLRFQARLGQLGNPLRMRQVRREIARAKTVLGQKRIQEAQAVQK